MAVGDIIAGISGDDTAINYQPAVGVHVIITCCQGRNLGTAPLIYDGVNQTSGGQFVEGNYSSMKMLITNSFYLRIGVRWAK